MTQLTLGLDRDSAIVAGLFDERDPAVKKMLSMAIKACPRQGQVRRHLRPGARPITRTSPSG
jgi:phosphoenolpyruvate synthase/pyruvate phosphate dikinase